MQTRHPLRQIANDISRQHFPFSMDAWICSGEDPSTFTHECHDEDEFCIGGWASVLHEQDDRPGRAEDLHEWLGLTPGAALNLFYRDQEAMNHPATACKVLEQLAKRHEQQGTLLQESDVQDIKQNVFPAPA